jgi:hypothetical protein
MHDYLPDVMIAEKLNLACFKTGEAPRAKHKAIVRDGITTLKVDIVAIARANGEDCLIDAFFDPQTLDTAKHGFVAGDPTFLAELKAALTALGLPSDTLEYAGEACQDEHVIALEAGADFARAVIARTGTSTAAEAA